MSTGSKSKPHQAIKPQSPEGWLCALSWRWPLKEVTELQKTRSPPRIRRCRQKKNKPTQKNLNHLEDPLKPTTSTQLDPSSTTKQEKQIATDQLQLHQQVKSITDPPKPVSKAAISDTTATANQPTTQDTKVDACQATTKPPLTTGQDDSNSDKSSTKSQLDDDDLSTRSEITKKSSNA